MKKYTTKDLAGGRCNLYVERDTERAVKIVNEAFPENTIEKTSRGSWHCLNWGASVPTVREHEILTMNETLVFPCEMIVWDEIEDHKTIRTVLGIFNDQYVVFDPTTKGTTYLTYLNASPVVEQVTPIQEYTCGRGEVSIGVGNDYISFSVLSSPRKVGEDITGMNLPESEQTRVYFENLESLKVLERKVAELRRRLQNRIA